MDLKTADQAWATDLPTGVTQLRRPLKALAWLSPDWAARFFFRQYATPRRRRLKSAHHAALAQARPARVRVSAYPWASNPLELSTYTWGSGPQTVVLLSGWEGLALDLYPLAQPLVAAGYQVLAVDWPAHGRSGGRRTNLPQMVHALHQLLGQMPAPVALVGHSIGGLAAALCLAWHPEVAVGQVALIASPASAQWFFERTFDVLEAPQPLRARVYAHIHQHLRRKVGQMSLRGQAGALARRRVLYLADETDHIVPVAHSRPELAALPGMEYHLVRSQGHFRLLRDPQVGQILRQWLAAGQV
jgi:pimeloyl-ACP methyl ester carboxylesterase